MKSKLIVALDVDTMKEAESLLKKLHKEVEIFKIGPQLFTRYGPRIIETVHKFKRGVFLDLKLYDIPNTVANTAAQITRLKVFMFTVHTQGGSKMMREAQRAAVEEAGKIGIKPPVILGVTVLSSFNRKGLKELNVSGTVDEQVTRLVRLARKAGIGGVVLSPKEAAGARKIAGRDFVIVCPGIRPAGYKKDDQKRTAGPKKAIESGADYIVVGRPVIKAARPGKAARKILAEIKGD